MYINTCIRENTYVLLYALCMNHERIAGYMYIELLYTYIYIYIHIMVYMIVYASCTHVETPLARPYRVSGVDALSQTSIRLPEYTEPVLQHRLGFHILDRLSCIGRWSCKVWRMRISTVRSESCGRWWQALASSPLNWMVMRLVCNSIVLRSLWWSLVDTSWHHIPIFTLLENAFLAQAISCHMAMPSGCKDGTVQVKPSNILKV